MIFTFFFLNLAVLVYKLIILSTFCATLKRRLIYLHPPPPTRRRFLKVAKCPKGTVSASFSNLQYCTIITTYKHNEIYDIHPFQWGHFEVTEKREPADIFPTPPNVCMGHSSLLGNVNHHQSTCKTIYWDQYRGADITSLMVRLSQSCTSIIHK